MESEPSTSEEDSEDSEDIPSEDKDAIEETHFRKLYHKILDDYIRRKNISDEKMAEAISFIIDSFRYKDGGDFSHIDFRRVEMICGYLFRYAPHGAGLTRCRTKEALRSCMQLRSILRKNELNVVSLGGGPGNDAIGFCSAISEFDFAGKLNIHVVDSIVKWSNVLSKAEKFLKEDALGNASEIFKQGKATLNFTQCRLPGGFRGSSDIPIGQCNIVLMCKLISIMKYEEKTGLVRKLHSKMKKTAFILLIDCPFEEELWCDKIERLYVSPEDQPYSSSIRQKLRFGHSDKVTARSRIAVLRKKR